MKSKEVNGLNAKFPFFKIFKEYAELNREIIFKKFNKKGVSLYELNSYPQEYEDDDNRINKQ